MVLTEADIMKVAGEVPEAPKEEPPASGKTEVDPRDLPISEKVVDLIFNGNDGSYDSRSEADAAVVTALIAGACTDAQIFHIFENYKIGERYLSKKGHGKRYLQGTIDKFRKTTEIKASISEEKIDNPIWESTKLLDTDFPVPDAIIGQGILPEGAMMMIEGESGDGKSMLRTELAIHVATGQPCWGLPIKKARRVFVFQFENTLSEERFRLKKMLDGLDMRSSMVHGMLAFSDPRISVDLHLKRDYMKAYQLVKKARADVVIWDPLSCIHSANENDNNQIRTVLNTLTLISRNLGTTCIVVHHFGKPAKDGNDISLAYRARGASAIRDWADTKVGVLKKKNEDRILRELHFTKIRNGPARPEILLERDNFFCHKIVTEETLCTVDIVVEILHRMGGNAESQAPLLEEIMSETGCGQRTAHRKLKESVDAGYVKTVTDGRKKGYFI
tara:strand:- start:291 stop:1628 length:1338 start_codon:yes stop_codon:yes gene_type:complete